MDWNKLEEQADLLMQRITGFESDIIATICKRVEKIGKLSSADKKMLANLSVWSTQDMDKVVSTIASQLSHAIPEMQDIYTDVAKETATAKASLYEKVGITQTAFADDKKAQSLVSTFAKRTGGDMINITKTRALYLVAPDGIPRPFKETAELIFAQASTAVTTGSQDFPSAMREALKKLGGGGLRVGYPNRTIRLDAVLRTNLLMTAKDVAKDYDDSLGEELGCNIRFISWHSNARKSHQAMAGGVYAIGRARVINGKYYESDSEPLRLMSEPNCNHDSYTGIAGVSEPQYTAKELAKLKESDTNQISYNGQTKTGTDWQKDQRNLQLRLRYAKDGSVALANANDMVGRRIQQIKINNLQAQLTALEKGTGLTPSPERASVASFRPVKPSE